MTWRSAVGRFVVTFGSAMTLLACSEPQRSRAEVTVLEPVGAVTGIAWLDDSTLVVERPVTRADGGTSFALWRVDLATMEAERLSPAESADCAQASYRFPELLPDGRIGAVQQCSHGLPGFELRTYVAVGDGGDIVELATLQPDDSWGEANGADSPDLNPTSTSWQPDGSEAISTVGAASCSALVGLDRHGVSALELSLPGDGSNVSRHALEHVDCERHVRARSAVFSPDGAELAFAASPDSAGVQGPGRIDERWNVYVRHDDGRVEEVLSDVRYLTGLDWSPDGSRLLVSGGTGGAEAGLAELDLATSELSALLDDDVASSTYSPDGTKVAFIRRSDDDAMSSSAAILERDSGR